MMRQGRERGVTCVRPGVRGVRDQRSERGVRSEGVRGGVKRGVKGV